LRTHSWLLSGLRSDAGVLDDELFGSTCLLVADVFGSVMSPRSVSSLLADELLPTAHSQPQLMIKSLKLINESNIYGKLQQTIAIYLWHSYIRCWIDNQDTVPVLKLSVILLT